jgi:hypothetical protein
MVPDNGAPVVAAGCWGLREQRKRHRCRCKDLSETIKTRPSSGRYLWGCGNCHAPKDLAATDQEIEAAIPTKRGTKIRAFPRHAKPRFGHTAFRNPQRMRGFRGGFDVLTCTPPALALSSQPGTARREAEQDGTHVDGMATPGYGAVDPRNCGGRDPQHSAAPRPRVDVLGDDHRGRPQCHVLADLLS